MSSIRCSNCDLVNFANQQICRRCQAPLSAMLRPAPQAYPPPAPPNPYGAQPPQLYHQPPPQQGYYQQPPARPAAPPYQPQSPHGPYQQHQPPPYQQPYAGGGHAQTGPQQTPYTGQYAYQGGARGYAPAMTRGVWRRYEQVVMSRDAELPNTCVKCGAAANEADKIKTRLYWHHPAVYAALVSPIIYAILAAIMSKRATIYVGLCEEHLASRRSNIWTSASLIAGGTLGFIYFFISGPVELSFISFILFAAGIIVASFYPPLKAAEIDDTHIWLKGAGQEFKESLPLWEGRGAV